MTYNERQELLCIAEENGTQAIPVLIKLVKDIIENGFVPRINAKGKIKADIIVEKGNQPYNMNNSTVYKILEAIGSSYNAEEVEFMEIQSNKGTCVIDENNNAYAIPSTFTKCEVVWRTADDSGVRNSIDAKIILGILQSQQPLVLKSEDYSETYEYNSTIDAEKVNIDSLNELHPDASSKICYPY